MAGTEQLIRRSKRPLPTENATCTPPAVGIITGVTQTSRRKKRAVRCEVASNVAAGGDVQSAKSEAVKQLLLLSPVVQFHDPAALELAVQHVVQADSRLAALALEHGLPTKLLAKQTNCFQSLARSIVYQQLAGRAADSIYLRFLACCQCQDSTELHPAKVLGANTGELRKCGLSQRKMSYLLDLAAHFTDGKLDDATIAAMEHAALRAELTKIKGIGHWTVDMFAMFHLGHPDILPVGDLGVRKGMQVLYQLKALPSPKQMEELTEKWRPYRSVGAYYMWRIPSTKSVERNVDF